VPPASGAETALVNKKFTRPPRLSIGNRDTPSGSAHSPTLHLYSKQPPTNLHIIGKFIHSTTKKLCNGELTHLIHWVCCKWHGAKMQPLEYL